MSAGTFSFFHLSPGTRYEPPALRLEVRTECHLNYSRARRKASEPLRPKASKVQCFSPIFGAEAWFCLGISHISQYFSIFSKFVDPAIFLDFSNLSIFLGFQISPDFLADHEFLEFWNFSSSPTFLEFLQIHTNRRFRDFATRSGVEFVQILNLRDFKIRTIMSLLLIFHSNPTHHSDI